MTNKEFIAQIRAEIERRIKELVSGSVYVARCELLELLSFIDSLQQEQSEYGYLSTTYIHGKKARWNVGDTLAYYLCTSDEEGEIIIGKITKVEFNNEYGWVYTFEDESAWDEQSLVEEGVYKIIENGK